MPLPTPLLDAWDRLCGRVHPFTPPRPLIPSRFNRLSEHHKTGAILAQEAIRFCSIRPEASVLDVGCGTGRVAIGLLDHLGKQGRYAGLEVDPRRVRWCQNTLARKYPNFSFHHMDVRNRLYHPHGTLFPEQVRLPWDSAQFDVVLLFSVFTHLLPAAVERYSSEIARLLKPGGRTLITWFLMTDEHLDRLRTAEKVNPPFLRGFLNGDRQSYWTTKPELPEQAVGYTEERVRSIYLQAGLKILEPIRYGTWPAALSGSNFQDYVIAEKPAC